MGDKKFGLSQNHRSCSNRTSASRNDYELEKQVTGIARAAPAYNISDEGWGNLRPSRFGIAKLRSAPEKKYHSHYFLDS
jgi:hypothetical protein